MSHIRADEDLHYSDGSHRWGCPDPDGDPVAWQARVAAHVEEHRRPEVLRAEVARRAPTPPRKDLPGAGG